MTITTFVHRRTGSDSVSTVGRVDQWVDFVTAAFTDQTGMGVVPVGDIDGDGTPDLVSMPWMRDVYVLEARPHLAAGVYAIELRTDTAAWRALSQRPTNPRRTDLSEAIKAGLPYLVVPGREPVAIAPGLSADDASGALCIGQHLVLPERAASGHWELKQSRMAFALIQPFIVQGVQSGGAQWRIVDQQPRISAMERMRAANGG